MRTEGLKISDKCAEAVCTLLTSMLEKAKGVEWKTPWLSVSEGLPVMNLKHKKSFNGVNKFILDLACATYKWRTPFFLTLEQLNAMGLRLQKKKEGDKMVVESYTPVFKWLPYYIKLSTNERVPLSVFDEMTEEEKENVAVRFTLRVFMEYNIDQTTMSTDMPDEYKKYVDIVEKYKHTSVANQKENAKDSTLDYILNTRGAWRCEIKHDVDGCAFYSPQKDFIHLPNKRLFFKTGGYYSTALHEMAHSTMTVPTMKRDYGERHFGDEGYATEELVAELTSAIVCHDIGLERKIDEQHLAYVNSWKEAVKNKDILKVIMNDIMKCVHYELNHYYKVKTMLEKTA